jgi:hypothetical protein
MRSVQRIPKLMGTSTRKIEIIAKLNMIEQNLREIPSGSWSMHVQALGAHETMERGLPRSRRWTTNPIEETPRLEGSKVKDSQGGEIALRQQRYNQKI